MLRNNVAAMLSHVGVNVAALIVLFLGESWNHGQSPTVQMVVSLASVGLYVFLGSRLRAVGSEWRNALSVVSVAVFNGLVYAYCWYAYLNARGGMRGIVWLLYAFANSYGWGFSQFVRLNYTWLVLTIPIPSLLLWTGLELRRGVRR